MDCAFSNTYVYHIFDTYNYERGTAKIFYNSRLGIAWSNSYRHSTLV